MYRDLGDVLGLMWMRFGFCYQLLLLSPNDHISSPVLVEVSALSFLYAL